MLWELLAKRRDKLSNALSTTLIARGERDDGTHAGLGARLRADRLVGRLGPRPAAAPPRPISSTPSRALRRRSPALVPAHWRERLGPDAREPGRERADERMAAPPHPVPACAEAGVARGTSRRGPAPRLLAEPEPGAPAGHVGAGGGGPRRSAPSTGRWPRRMRGRSGCRCGWEPDPGLRPHRAGGQPRRGPDAAARARSRPHGRPRPRLKARPRLRFPHTPGPIIAARAR